MHFQPEKILVIRHGAFGDIVQVSGAFRDIREHHPDGEISVLTTPPFAKLLKRCPFFDHVITDDRPPVWKVSRLLALRRTLRTAGFDRVYDLQNSDRTDLYHRLFMRNAIWHGPGKRRPPVIGRRIPRRPGLQRYDDQLRDAGIATHHTRQPDVSWMVDDVSSILQTAGVNDPYIALIPGSSARHPYKRWPHYADLAKRLIDRGYHVVTAPGPDEIELCKTIPGEMLMKPDGKVLNWFELAGVLNGAAFVAGNDTGPSHIASCLDRPGLALFGPHTSVESTGIRQGRFDAIEVEDLRELSTDRVLEEVISRLADHS